MAFFKHTRLIIKEKPRQQPINQDSSTAGAPTYESLTALIAQDTDSVQESPRPQHGVAVGVTDDGVAVDASLEYGSGSNTSESYSDVMQQRQGWSITLAVGGKTS